MIPYYKLNKLFQARLVFFFSFIFWHWVKHEEGASPSPPPPRGTFVALSTSSTPSCSSELAAIKPGSYLTLYISEVPYKR